MGESTSTKEVSVEHNDDENGSQVSKLSGDDDASTGDDGTHATGKTGTSEVSEKDLAHNRSRNIVVGFLAIGGVVCATVTYLFIAGHAKDDFEVQVCFPSLGRVQNDNATSY